MARAGSCQQRRNRQMLRPDELEKFVLESMQEILAELRDTISGPVHCDLYDDFGGGRVASFELDKHGKLDWWNWRDSACTRAEFPLKLRLEFDDTRAVVWLRGDDIHGGQSWSLEDRRSVSRTA